MQERYPACPQRCHSYSHQDTQANLYGDIYTNQYLDPDRHPNADQHGYANARSYKHADLLYSHADTDPHCIRHAHPYGHTRAAYQNPKAPADKGQEHPNSAPTHQHASAPVCLERRTCRHIL